MAEILENGKTKKEIYDEQKAAKQALKEKEAQKAAKKLAKTNKAYRNPINSHAGKFMIWFLCLAMVAGIVFTFVYLLINLWK